MMYDCPCMLYMVCYAANQDLAETAVQTPKMPPLDQDRGHFLMNQYMCMDYREVLPKMQQLWIMKKVRRHFNTDFGTWSRFVLA